MVDEPTDNEVGAYDPVPIRELFERNMQDPEYREIHLRNAPKYALIEAMLDARSEADMTLEEIAQKMGTTKSALSRMLSGAQMPNWKTVARYAAALGKQPVITFEDRPQS